MDTTLLRGLRLLEAISIAGAPQSITSLSKQLDEPKSSVHRTLSTLVKAGFVTRDETTSRYSATLKLWELGSSIISRNFLRRAALPFMRQLHQESQETVYLAILDGTDVMYLEKIDAVFPLVLTSQPARRMPAIRPASGLAIVAHHPDGTKLARKIIAADRSGTDIKDVVKEFKDIRRRGFATRINGWSIGTRSVAAPILGSSAVPLGSIGVAGPTERIDDATLERYSILVRNAAMRIAELAGNGDVNPLAA